MNRRLFVAILVVLMALPGWAQYKRRSNLREPDTYHFGYLTGSAGYSALIDNVVANGATIQLSGNVGGLFGLGYEFRTQGFWSAVGAEFQLINTKCDNISYSKYYCSPEFAAKYGNQFGDVTSTATVLDTRNKSVVYRYSVQEQDLNQWWYLNIPVMLGYYHKGYYIGAGLKVGFNMPFSGTKVTGSYSTAGWDPTLALCADEGQWLTEADAPNDYTTRDISQSSTHTNLRPQLNVIFETGYDVLSTLPTRSSMCQILKVGVYMECGTMNINVNAKSTGGEESLTPTHPTVDMRDATIYPYYGSKMSADNTIIPYYVGLKLTYMIGGSSTVRGGVMHKGCQCYE